MLSRLVVEGSSEKEVCTSSSRPTAADFYNWQCKCKNCCGCSKVGHIGDVQLERRGLRAFASPVRV